MRTEIVSIVFNEDCMEGMKQFEDGFFDLMIVDIPYGIKASKMAYLQEVKKTVKQKNGTSLRPKNKTVYEKKDWDNEVPSQSYFNELRRVSKHQIIFGIEYTNWEGVGTGRIKWDKGVAEGVSFNRYETAYCSLINETVVLPLLWAGMCQAKSLKEPMTQQGNKKLNEKRIHPTQKPVMLYHKLLLDYGKGCKRIGDTHLGSGSHRIAAYKLGFDFWAWEKDKDYFDGQEQRFIKATAAPLFDDLKKAI